MFDGAYTTVSKPKPLTLAIACSSLCLGKGGTERAATRLANDMAARGHTVLLLSLRYTEERGIPAYEIDDRVQHWNYPFSQKHADIKKLQQRLLTAGVDVLLSMQSCSMHLYWAMACMGSGIPFICSERCDPIEYIEKRGWHRQGRYAVLTGADCIHELLDTYRESVPPWCRERVRVIPNAAPKCDVTSHVRAKSPRILLYLARFDPQKKPDVLVDAFSLIAKHVPEWELHFYGHGRLEAALRTHIAQSTVASRIRMRGVCHDAQAAFASAHLYCLPSEYEGFPNTVLEAMQTGLPVVGFAQCRAMRCVVHDGHTGLLASEMTAKALAETLLTLMQDDTLRQSMGQAAHEACGAYNAQNIHGQWEGLFYEMAARKGHTVMDSFAHEPFASKARLSAAARREWIFRNFGEPMPYSSVWWWDKICSFMCKLWNNRMYTS